MAVLNGACVLVYACLCIYDWLILSKDNINAIGPETSLLSKSLIDAGWTNLSKLIRVFYSYQCNLSLAITIVYGNQDMFWSSLVTEPSVQTTHS